MTKRVFVVHNAPTGYIGNRPPAPRTNVDAGGWVLWADRDKAVPAPRTNAAAVIDDGEWFDYDTGKRILRTNAAVDDGGWVSWEDRNRGAAPRVNSNDEWQPYIKPEVL